jgi:anti-anti-sigma factor
VDDLGDRVVVALAGELDLATAPSLEEVVLPLVAAGRHAVVDLRGLEFMDSTGVRVLVAANAAASDHDGRVSLVRSPPGSAVQRVLEISGLESVLTVVDAP